MAWPFYEWAKDQSVKPAARKLILLLVADHANIDEGCAWPSLSYLAIESGLSERQVHAHIKALATEDKLIRIEKCKSKKGAYEYNRYWLLATAEEFAPYLVKVKKGEDPPFKLARRDAADARAAALQERPSGEPEGEVIPLGAMLPNGSTASSPTEAWRPGQRKRTSVKPQREPQCENPRDGATSVERSGSESLAPRRAVANAPASETKPLDTGRKIYPRGRPVKNPTTNQRALQEASGLIDRLGDSVVAAALKEFADRCGRVIDWARDRVVENARITVPIEDLSHEDHWAYQRHVYYWCMKNFVESGNWPPELLEPLRVVKGVA
jgi:hypothetical protein